MTIEKIRHRPTAAYYFYKIHNSCPYFQIYQKNLLRSTFIFSYSSSISIQQCWEICSTFSFCDKWFFVRSTGILISGVDFGKMPLIKVIKQFYGNDLLKATISHGLSIDTRGRNVRAKVIFFSFKEENF